MAEVELSTLGGVIKTAYEAENNTNAFTDAEKSKLAELPTAWNDIPGKPAVIAAGTTQQEARDAINAIDKALIGVPGGLAELDDTGSVPLDQLNVSSLTFKGAWYPSTNTPTLINGTGEVGDFYKAAEDGSFNFGNGTFEFNQGDWVMFAAGVWQRIGSKENVASVNGKMGAVVLTAADVGALPDTYSPSWDDVADKPDFQSLYASKMRGAISAPVPAVFAGISNTISVPTGVTTVVKWDVMSLDAFSLHNGSGGFVVPAWATHAQVIVRFTFSPNSTGNRTIEVRMGGELVMVERRGAVSGTWSNINLASVRFPVTPGSVIDTTVFQDSGVSLTVPTTAQLQIDLYTTN